MRKIEGRVLTYTPINVRNVRFELDGSSEVIELQSEHPWLLRSGDHVAVVGEDDGRSGVFHGYAYRNDTRQTRGQTDVGLVDGVRYISLGLLFAWAIFPLFIHVPWGLRRLAFGRKVEQAASML